MLDLINKMKNGFHEKTKEIHKLLTNLIKEREKGENFNRET